MINTIMRGSPGRTGRRKALLVPPRGRWVMEDRLCPRILESRNLPSRQKEGKAEKTRATQHSGGADAWAGNPAGALYDHSKPVTVIWEEQGGHFAKSPGNLNRVEWAEQNCAQNGPHKNQVGILKTQVPKSNPLIHFGLILHHKSLPVLHYTPQPPLQLDYISHHPLQLCYAISYSLLYS